MSSKKKGNTNRLLAPGWPGSPPDEFRLWDRAGELWTGSIGAPVDRQRVEALYFDSTLPVAISDGGGTLRWIEPLDRRRVWDAGLRARTTDRDWEPPSEAPGTLPFDVYALGRRGKTLLLFYDND